MRDCRARAAVGLSSREKQSLNIFAIIPNNVVMQSFPGNGLGLGLMVAAPVSLGGKRERFSFHYNRILYH